MTGRAQQRNLSNPVVREGCAHCSAQSISWEGGTAKVPFPPSPAWKGYLHQWKQTPVASALPRPDHETISHQVLLQKQPLTTTSVRSHPPEPSPEERRDSFTPSPSLPGKLPDTRWTLLPQLKLCQGFYLMLSNAPG